MNPKLALWRSLIVVAALAVALLILLRILLPPGAFVALVVEGLEPICCFGLLPLPAIETPAYFVYRLLIRRRPPTE